MKTDNKAHAKYSASGAKRWLACPGSVHLSEGIPSTESAAAKHGTQAHELLEMLLNAWIDNKNQDVFFRDYPEKTVEDVCEVAEAITSLVSEGAELLCETKVSLEFVGPDMFGTVDAAIIEHFKKLTVIDFKYGISPVHPKDNPQLIYYALGLAHKYHYEFETIELRIIQPRAKVGGETTRTHTMTMKELKEWAAIFSDGRRAAEDFVAPLVMGDHCFFCPARPICPKHTEKREFQAALDFDGIIDEPALQNEAEWRKPKRVIKVSRKVKPKTKLKKKDERKWQKKKPKPRRKN